MNEAVLFDPKSTASRGEKHRFVPNLPPGVKKIPNAKHRQSQKRHWAAPITVGRPRPQQQKGRLSIESRPLGHCEFSLH